MSTSNRVTKALFWLAFGAFLAMSIPHIAFIFHFYEPKNDGYSTAWWIVSYGVAIGIDMLICWLSYTRSEMEGATPFDGFVTWAFIVLLAILSWFCNWLFAEIMIGVNVWGYTVPLIGWTVGSFTPFVVSAIPMFLIAYTYMSKRILNTHVVTVAELEQQAIILESRQVALNRIADVKKTRNIAAIRGMFDTVKAVRNEIGKHPQSEQSQVHDTGPIVNPSAVEEVYTEDRTSGQVEDIQDTRDTPGEIPVVRIEKTPKSPVSRQSGDASARVYKVLKSSPNASIPEVMNRAKVSRSYASRIRSQWQHEQLQSA